MGDIVDKEILFSLTVPEQKLELPGLGTIRVRGLSRVEMLLAGKHDTVAEVERWMLHFGIVEPALTVKEVERWQRAAPSATFQPITMLIRELSGHGEGADKSGVSEVREQPDA